jgi:MFS transporter, NNP family, nitrate/nitrite transporter
MVDPPSAIRAGENPPLRLSTAAYMVSVAAWTLFSVIGIQIERELGLTDAEFGVCCGGIGHMI